MNIPKRPAERRAWIIYQLRLRNLSLRALARREGVVPQAMTMAASGAASSHLQDVLAQALGLETSRLFPEFFDDQGNRLGWTREKQRTTRRRCRNDQEGEAA